MKFPVALFSIAVMVLGITVSSEGVINRVLRLDGDEDCVEVPDNDILDFRADDSFTLEAWILLTNSNAVVLAKRTPGFDQTYALDLTEQYVEIFVRDAASTNNKQYVIGTFAINDRRWHHVAGVRDKSQNKLFLYVDGELEGQLDDRTGDLSNPENLYIGRHIYRSCAGYTQGDIDEVRIWNIPRSHEEIRATMNTSLTGQEDGLIAYWNFDDGTANDMTQNRNDGRLLADAEIVENELPDSFVHKGIDFISIEDRIVNPGERFAVNVYARTSEELHSFAFDLSFDPSVLKALRIEEGSLLSHGGVDSKSWDEPGIDNAKGVIGGIRCARTGKDGLTDEGTLVSVTFEARETGSTDLSIPSVRLLSPEGEDMPASLRRGVVNVYSYGSISGTVYGKVLDWPTVRPVLGARVQVSRDGFTFGISAESDYDGKYRIENVPVGRFDVVASRYYKGEYVEGTVPDVNVMQAENTADIDVTVRSFDSAPEIVIPKPLADGEKAPDFTLKDVHGKEVSLSDFRGKPVILNFWASTSDHCIREIQNLSELCEKYSDDDLVFIGISKERAIADMPGLAGLPASHISLLQGEEVFQLYGVRVIPCKYYIDRSGRIKRRSVGYRDVSGIESDIQVLLKE